MISRIIGAVASAALLSACGGGAVEPESADTVDAPAEHASSPSSDAVSPETVPARVENLEPASDIKIDIDSEPMTAAVHIDGAITDFAPGLSARIKSDVEMALEKAKTIAAEDFGEEYFIQHDYQYDYKKSASVGDVISVEYFEMYFTGGAHPNYLLGGILHDRASGEDIAAPSLLSEDGIPAMKALLKDELAKQKLERMSMDAEDLSLMRQDVEDIFPKELDYWFGQVTLVPAKDMPEKFGGLVVHYSPYDVGAYAEGSYDILVSASRLDGLLAEPYASMFGGEPVYEEAEEN